MTAIDPASITTEIQVGGTWYSTYAGIDLSHRVRGGDSIRLTRGYVDQQSSYSATAVSLTLNNGDGLFSPKNPYSPLYGKIKQNLPVRVGVQDGNGTWEEYVRLPDVAGTTTNERFYTADKASLDITGDIDIRVDVSPTYMRGTRQNLASKWELSAAGRAWLFELREDGQLSLTTSPDGTLASAVSGLSGVTLAENSGRFGARVTLDVNDGAGNRVYRFYTARTIAGPWSLIATATTAGVTTIVNSPAALEIGTAAAGIGPFTTSRQFAGKIHAFELYNGIAGTLVADVKPAGRGVGQVSWADTCASPNTWLISGADIRLASDRIRATLELSALPETWDVTGQDRYVQATAASLGKRYVSNKGAIGSPIYRLYRNRSDLIGYWALEDGSGATTAANTVAPQTPGILTSCTFGTTTGLDGSSGSMTLTSAPNVSRAVFNAQFPTADTGGSSILFYFKMTSLPAADSTFLTLNMAPGAALRWVLVIGTGSFRFIGYNLIGAEILNTGPWLFTNTGDTPVDTWFGMQISFTQDGSNIRLQTSWHVVGQDVFYTHNPGGTTTAGTLGRGITRAIFNTPDSAYAGTELAHVIISDSGDLNLVSGTFASVSKGYAGEAVGRRMQRLAAEEGETFEWIGDLDDTQPAGPQSNDRLLNLFQSAAQVDGGIFGDIRDMKGWRYVTRAALGNRRGLPLYYSLSYLSQTPKPVTDDRYLVNDFTASRPQGGSRRYVADDNRPLNVNDPDAASNPGVGRYEQSGSFNAADDDQLYYLASAQVAIGTYDAFRIPNVAMALHRDEISSRTTVTAGVIEHDFGDPLTITSLSGAPMAPDDVDLITFGYTEVIGQAGTWEIVYNTVAAGPYQVPIFGGGTTDVNGEPRMDADFGGHVQVHGAYASSATSIILRVDQNFAAKQVIDSTSYSAEFPVDIKIAGERMTMTACTAPTSVGAPAGYKLQTATVTRAVNTVAKALADGDEFHLADTFDLGLI